MPANSDAAVLDDATDAERALVADIAAMLKYDEGAAVPDPAFVAACRARLMDEVARLGVLGVKIPALSVRQAWAGLLSGAFKPCENRSRRTHYRGPVFIHASAGKPTAAPLRPDGTAYAVPEHLQARGALLALATLVDCHEAAGCEACGTWGESTGFHWIFADVRPLTSPIPAKGMLGLWKPAPGLIAEALGQIEAAEAGAWRERFRAACAVFDANGLKIRDAQPWQVRGRKDLSLLADIMDDAPLYGFQGGTG